MNLASAAGEALMGFRGLGGRASFVGGSIGSQLSAEFISVK
jgi:predicted Zn-dependent protease